MNAPNKTTLKMLNQIRQQILQSRRNSDDVVEYLRIVTDPLEQLSSVRRKIELASRHSLESPLQHLRNQALTLVHDLQQQAVWASARLSNVAEQPATPTLRELLAELEQIEEEFGAYEYDRSGESLSVTTDPITLEGTYLGPFEIKLPLRAVGARDSRSHRFRVVALEPNTPGGREEITHPHVSHEELCEGEASPAIRAALGAGRICDFFLLVRGVLSTYNPSSPYVSLDKWSGFSCADCDGYIDDNDCHYCEECGHEHCSDCMGYCAHCSESVCHECQDNCQSCDDPICGSCINTCRACEQSFCPDCIEEELCPDCRAELENNDEPAPPGSETAPGSEPGPDPEIVAPVAA